MINNYKSAAQMRRSRVRHKLKRVSQRPRLVVNRSNKHIFAQIVDKQGKVLASASDLKAKKGTKVERATQVGQELAKLAKKAKVTQVAFDRGNYKYHGRVKAVAQAARAGGLEF